MSETNSPVRVPRFPFVLSWILAPVLFGLVCMLFTFGGAYGERFARVGIIGLLAMLPGYLIVFAPMAWRAVQAGRRDIKTFVFAGLWANGLHLIFYPVLILLAWALGLMESGGGVGLPAELAQEDVAVTMGSIPSAIFAGFVVFFLGLFFMPPLTAIFGLFLGTLARR